MTLKKSIRNFFEDMDLSDIRLLAAGLILLLIPVSYLTYNNFQRGKGLARKSITERIDQNRVLFSFQRKQSEHPATKSTGRNRIKPVENPDRQWSEAVARVNSSKRTVPPGMTGVSAAQRMMFDAEMSTEIRVTNMLIAQKRFDEAKAICARIMKTETDNDFLLFMASGNLCTIYDSTGDSEALHKEFQNYLDLLEKLKEHGLAVGDIKTGYMAMKNMTADWEKIKTDPAIRKILTDMIAKRPLTQDLTADKIIDKTDDMIRSFP